MIALRSVAWSVLSDFGLQLCIVFLLALCAEHQRQQRKLAAELQMQLPDLPGRTAADEPSRPPMVVEWDGTLIAVDGRVLGPGSDTAILGLVERLVADDHGRRIVLRIPSSPYTELRRVLGNREVLLEVAGR